MRALVAWHGGLFLTKGDISVSSVSFLYFKKNPIAAKETIVDGGDKKYGNSHFSEQNRQNSISRFNNCRLHRIAREAPGALTVWRHEQMVKSTVQAAQEHHSIWMPLYDSMHAA